MNQSFDSEFGVTPAVPQREPAGSVKFIILGSVSKFVTVAVVDEAGTVRSSRYT